MLTFNLKDYVHSALMMKESKLDLINAHLITSIFFICHLFFTSESNPMHSYVYVPLFDKVCLIEKYIPQEYPTTSRMPIFIYNSLESCIAACSSYSTGELLCNAFMYSDITKACHLHFYALNLKTGMCPVETGQSQFYLLHGCFNNTLRFETSFVSLHEFHERCQILTFTSAYAENLKVHSLLSQTNSLNGCLTACRNKTNDTLNCSGVLFSKQEEVCYKLVEGTSHDQIVTEDDKTIVLLQRCVKDREEERRGNSIFYHYHLYELEEMCVFESYDSNHISSFAVYENILKANSLYECILKCASEQISEGCAAVHKSQEGCLFFRRNSTARIFRKLGTSYFAELLYCESNCFKNVNYILPVYTYNYVHGNSCMYVYVAIYNSNVTVNHRIEVESKREMPRHVETLAIKNAVLKQHIFFTAIFIANFNLINCNWMSIYVPKIDATCALVVKKINHFESRYIERLFCSLESCVAICFQHQFLCNSIKYTPFAKQCDLYNMNGTYHSVPEDAETGQSKHLLLHSCHREISNVPVRKIIYSTSLNADVITADVHLPSIHRVCRVQRRPFAENYGIRRLQLITASSLKRCLAACDIPSNSLCNSVLFSVQENTCILLARRQSFFPLQGSTATVSSAAQYFIILYCLSDFKRSQLHATQSVRRQSAIAYIASNKHLQIAIHHELFYASKAAIRLRLCDSADEKECLKICIASNTTDGCNAYYFSSREHTCLTMRLKKQYALPGRHNHRSITKFYDDETLNITFKDANEQYLKYTEHAIQMEVSLHEFKEICVAQHWISTLIPNIRFNKRYANISFFNECINICRHLKNSDECKGIAYSKKMKTCMVAVEGNENDEILLSNDQHYLTLSSCIKDRETERTNNEQLEFCFIPELDEICLVELYQPLFLSGWEIITRIDNTFSLQDCLFKCASVMNVKKCSAVNYIDQQCVLLERTNHTKFIRSLYSVFAELLYCE
ncbi:hypothetical protein T11_651 [Trichinella zimbabwensis]|uniref:Apple domain-containing protein n=1 Tax=Trichinella zimbabwensis TaxID=268475 RepID=A0A0V1HW02_9BILA|nr:hypothetical protein T11_651 [Trichinella zimbabwensis]